MYLNSSLAGAIGQILKGVIIAVLITLVSVLIFAFILSMVSLSDKAIRPINQFIKTLSVLLAVLFSVRGGRFLIKGGLIGLLSAFSAFFNALSLCLVAIIYLPSKTSHQHDL